LLQLLRRDDENSIMRHHHHHRGSSVDSSPPIIVRLGSQATVWFSMVRLDAHVALPATVI